MSLGETGLQELTVVSKNSKINSSVSAADIIALKQSEEGRGKGLDGSFKHSRSVSDQILSLFICSALDFNQRNFMLNYRKNKNKIQY